MNLKSATAESLCPPSGGICPQTRLNILLQVLCKKENMLVRRCTDHCDHHSVTVVIFVIADYEIGTKIALTVPPTLAIRKPQYAIPYHFTSPVLNDHCTRIKTIF